MTSIHRHFRDCISWPGETAVHNRDDQRKHEQREAREHLEYRILDPEMRGKRACHQQGDAHPSHDREARPRNPDEQQRGKRDLQDSDKVAQPVREPVLFELLDYVCLADDPDEEDRASDQGLKRNAHVMHGTSNTARRATREKKVLPRESCHDSN
jgi:hypothetical protein